eukprot:sb/3461614/
MSWNINSMTSNGVPKHHDKPTLEMFTNHDIVCLQEIRQDTPVPNFTNFTSVRLTKLTGGVGFLVKQNIIEGVQHIEFPNPDISVLKLCGKFFGLGENTYIVNTYARPENASGRHIKSGVETIEDCEELVSNLQKDGSVILVGDFNARIANDPCQAHESDNGHVPIPPFYVPDTVSPRCSEDKKVNSHGKSFKNLVMNNQLNILNGRTLGDFTGRFTSVQYNGCAVVDYIATTSDIFQQVDYMKVLPLLPTSDHRPLVVQIQCQPFNLTPHQKLGDLFETAPAKFIVSEESKSAFQDAQEKTDTLDSLSSIENMLACGDQPSSVYNSFQSHVQSLCKLTFKTTNPSNAAKINNTKPWHTKKLTTANRLLVKATRLTENFPEADSIRRNYYSMKGNYRRMIRKAKSCHDTTMNRNIEDGKIINWQAFEKLKQDKSNPVTHTTIEMEKFQDFFQQLYSDEHPTISLDKKEDMLAEADLISNQAKSSGNEDPVTIMNAPISLEELTKTIKSLKTGKAAGEDLIPNEVLKLLDRNHLVALLKVFNACFNDGYYPWTNSIITPLHKKGNRANPDNYRAVAVSSAIEEGVYLEQAQNYCYLGIKVSSNGDFNVAARDDLHLKAVRAMYALRRTIRKDKLSLKACKTLFTALVKPILLYGAPIWTPLTRTIRKLITAAGSGPTLADANLLRSLSADKAERLFLSHLKWSLGVNKKTQNAAIWEDTDSTPLSIDAIDLTLRFLYRIKRMNPASFVNASYHEQKNLGLPWYKSMREILEKDPTYSMNHFDANMVLNGQKNPEDIEPSPTRHHLPSRHFRVPILKQQVMETYQTAKRSAIQTSRKLELYRSIDHQPGLPPYALSVSNYEHRSAMAKLRMSAHCLMIETGRHQNIPRENRHCPSCKLTMGEEIVETESHALDDCDLYNPERQELLESIRNGPDHEPSLKPNLPKHRPITHLTCDTASHQPRTVGLLARFVAAMFAKRARWDSIANAINSTTNTARLATGA